MPLTKATTNVVNLDKDTLINGVTAGKGAGNVPTNTAFGLTALATNTTGIANTAIGESALELNTTASSNTAVGRLALQQNTIGYSNVAVGRNALQVNTTGYQNTAVGTFSLDSNTLGNSNVAVGLNTLQSNTTGDNNTAVGCRALDGNTIGYSNVAVGVNALEFNDNGANNAAVGSNALQDNTNGNQNVAVGTNALSANTTGIQNTAVGANTLITATALSNAGAFGYNAQPTVSDTIRIGNTFITSVVSQVGSWSDERDKADIRDTVLGLDFIKELRPVDYKWDYREDYRELPPESPSIDATEDEINKYKQDLKKWREDSQLKNLVRDGSKKRTRFHHGLIAQELKSVIESTGVDFGGFQDHTIKGGDAVMTIGYTELIGPLIKAVQELSAEVAALKAK